VRLGRKKPNPKPALLNSSSLVSRTTSTDYSELDRALRNREWEAADKLTLTLMLKVMNTSSSLDTDEIRRFPGEDLKLLDNLWVQYSEGKLGFSVQKRIWQECGSPGPDYEANKTAWKQFGQRVNWQGGTGHNQWRYKHELDYSNPQKYSEHLPLMGWGGLFAEGRVGSFLSRRDLNCSPQSLQPFSQVRSQQRFLRQHRHFPSFLSLYFNQMSSSPWVTFSETCANVCRSGI